jgi:hypothetical protein
MPKPRNEPVSDAIDVSVFDMDDHKQHRRLTNAATPVVPIDRPFLSSPTTVRRQRSSKNQGPWTRLLATLKSNQAIDAMKLQHAGMNRHGVAVDLNDPRRKAKTYTDVTIVGREDCNGVALPICWSHGREGASTKNGTHQHDGLLTVLCHIHTHGAMIRGNPTSTTISQVFAWISFTRTTARNVGLQSGLELRLYGAILVPIRRAPCRSTPHDRQQCRFIVLCTHLCEKYPGKLDPVPCE